MRKLILVLCCMALLTLPVSAGEITPPEVPESGRERMPENTESFAQGLEGILRKALGMLHPDLEEACQISLRVLCAVLLCSVLQSFSGPSKRSVETAASVFVAVLLLESTNSLIHLGAETITDLSEYEKLLLPVMTAALAAQGGSSSSAVLYSGTAMFDFLLSKLISNLLVPMVYLILAVSVAGAAMEQEIMKKIQSFLKWFVNWSLKTVLTIFTAYISISGVVSGTTDTIALKATKMTISSVVPVVGGILSDASEAVLVGAGVMKNAAGIYGLLAALAVFLSPFLKISVHFLVLKLTAALAGLFGPKAVAGLIEDFSAAMALLLAMTGASCLLLLISTVCFLKGVA